MQELIPFLHETHSGIFHSILPFFFFKSLIAIYSGVFPIKETGIIFTLKNPDSGSCAPISDKAVPAHTNTNGFSLCFVVFFQTDSLLTVLPRFHCAYESLNLFFKK